MQKEGKQGQKKEQNRLGLERSKYPSEKKEQKRCR